MSKVKVFGFLIAGLLFITGSAQAALLDVIGGSALTALPGDFTASTAPGTGITAGSLVTYGGVLTLSAAVPVVVEYLGKEAVHENTFNLGAAAFNTESTTLPSSPVVAGTFGPGAIPFTLSDLTTPGSITNGGGSAGVAVTLAFASLGNNSFLVLFDDGGAGADWDDMVVKVSAVPLPAAAWLLISAILGLVSMSRFGRRGEQTT